MITLKRLDCKKIRLVAEGTAYNAPEGSKLVGKTFNTYQYNGIRFIVNCDEEFCKLHASSKLAEVDLTEGTMVITATDGTTSTKATLAVENWLSHSDLIEDANFDAQLKSISVKFESVSALEVLA